MGHRVFAVGSILACVACEGGTGDGTDDTDNQTDSDTDLGSDTDDAVENCFADPMMVTPGTGADAFMPLTEGQEITIWHGPQGGWHIDTAGEAFHSPQNVSILSVITALDLPVPVVIAGEGGPLEAENRGLAAYDDELCSGQFWGVRAFVDDAEPPVGSSLQQVVCTLAGQRLELAITVTEIPLEGATEPPRSATSSVIVTAALDAVDEAVCNN